MWINECDSTNDEARKLAESGAPHGTWVASRRQRLGRGRAGRKWESSEGNLFLSLIARAESLPPRENWTWIPLATGVAIAEEFQLQVKWPNDLFISASKVGGILCESQKDFVIIGIGLNCETAPTVPGQPEFKTGALGQKVDEVLPVVVSQVIKILGDLKEEGPSALSKRFLKVSLFKPGDPIRWRGKSGEMVGLGSFGELLVKDPAGKISALLAEDIS